jgi:outer membrane protein TolC
MDDGAGKCLGTAMRASPWKRVPCVPMLLGCLLALGCGAAHYRESADRDIYRIIDQKSESIDGMPSEFSIEEGEKPLVAEEAASATRAVSLRDALEIAVEYSRWYQSREESLYSQGLALSSARHEFNPRPFAAASAVVEGGDGDETVVSALSLGISKMLATGAELSVSIVTDLSRVLSGDDPGEAAASTINASLVQPLLRGSGRKVATENLTQAERNMVYAIRDFVRFRKSFSVDVAKNYYNLLQRQDRVDNAWNNYLNLIDDRERATLMAEAGRLPEFEVDQTEQDELRAKDSWVLEVQAYQNALDQFKIDLGLPTEMVIEPATAELRNLDRYVSAPIEVTNEEATDVALDSRLDLKTVTEQVEDAGRKIEVAIDALRADLDLTLTYQADTEGETRPVKFSGGYDRYSAGALIDLPLDRLPERNAYRQSLIDLAAAARDLSEKVDQIKLEVRESFRDLEQARQSFEIQKESLRLAERRVDSTTLLQQAGRATTRDVLESREALLQARNLVTAALVDYFNARLDLLLAMETLRIDDRGFWMGANSGEPDEQIQ